MSSHLAQFYQALETELGSLFCRVRIVNGVPPSANEIAKSVTRLRKKLWLLKTQIDIKCSNYRNFAGLSAATIYIAWCVDFIQLAEFNSILMMIGLIAGPMVPLFVPLAPIKTAWAQLLVLYYFIWSALSVFVWLKLGSGLTAMLVFSLGAVCSILARKRFVLLSQLAQAEWRLAQTFSNRDVERNLVHTEAREYFEQLMIEHRQIVHYEAELVMHNGYTT